MSAHGQRPGDQRSPQPTKPCKGDTKPQPRGSSRIMKSDKHRRAMVVIRLGPGMHFRSCPGRLILSIGRPCRAIWGNVDFITQGNASHCPALLTCTPLAFECDAFQTRQGVAEAFLATIEWRA